MIHTTSRHGCFLINTSSHYSLYLSYCYKLLYKKQMGAPADFTALLDWTSDQLDELGDLSVKYSGMASIYEEIEMEEKERHVRIASRNFTELSEYNVPEKKCSTSWVTAVIEAAEAALENRVKLSVKQLFECFPKEEGLDGCRGIHPSTLSLYLSETGLVSENDFTSCESIEETKRHRFTIVSPDAYNAGGLVSLIDEGDPVFVLVAIDLQKMRFVRDMSQADEGLKCAGYQPSLYGVVTGYKYSEVTGESWWELATHVIPAERVIVKIPMNGNMTNSNYAGIAAFAFALKRNGDLPEIEPTAQVPTYSPSSGIMTDSPVFPTTHVPVITTTPTQFVTTSPIVTSYPTTVPTVEGITEAPVFSEAPTTEPSTVAPTEEVTEGPIVTDAPTEEVTEGPSTESPSSEPLV